MNSLLQTQFNTLDKYDYFLYLTSYHSVLDSRERKHKKDKMYCKNYEFSPEKFEISLIKFFAEFPSCLYDMWQSDYRSKINRCKMLFHIHDLLRTIQNMAIKHLVTFHIHCFVHFCVYIKNISFVIVFTPMEQWTILFVNFLFNSFFSCAIPTFVPYIDARYRLIPCMCISCHERDVTIHAIKMKQFLK